MRKFAILTHSEKMTGTFLTITQCIREVYFVSGSSKIQILFPLMRFYCRTVDSYITHFVFKYSVISMHYRSNTYTYVARGKYTGGCNCKE